MIRKFWGLSFSVFLSEIYNSTTNYVRDFAQTNKSKIITHYAYTFIFLKKMLMETD